MARERLADLDATSLERVGGVEGVAAPTGAPDAASAQPGALAAPSSSDVTPVTPPAPPAPPALALPPRGPTDPPRHPYWEGLPATETALRLLHLWPRAVPAPTAIKFAVADFHQVMAAAHVAHQREGIRASTQVVIDALALAHRDLDLHAAGRPALGLIAGDADVPLNDPARIGYDATVLRIAKLQAAIQRAYDQGGEAREALAAVTRPSWETEGAEETTTAPEGAGATR